MLDKTINLSIPVKESILFSLKESTDGNIRGLH